MAKRGRQKNRTGNTKRSANSPAAGAESAARLAAESPVDAGDGSEVISSREAPVDDQDAPVSRPRAIESTRPEAASERPPAEEPKAEPTESKAASERPPVEEPKAEPTESKAVSERPPAEEPKAEPTEAKAASERPPVEEPKVEPTKSKSRDAKSESKLTTDTTPLAMDVSKAEADELEEDFFSAPSLARLEDEADEADEDPRLRRLQSPEVVARRAQAQRYVMWVVAGLAALFVVALIVKSTSSEEPSSSREPQRPLVTVQQPTETVEVAPPAVEPSAAAQELAPAASVAPAPSAAVDTPPEPVVAEPVAPAPSAVVETQPEPAAAEPVAPAPSAAVGTPAATGVAEDDAKSLRTRARKLLSQGKAAAAIEPALQSTSLDPEHADGWLLLGAAYQDRGQRADARAAFQQCVNVAKRGPRGECMAMLR